MTYPNAVFSAFAFTGFVMCAIPLPWHLQAWNTGTCMYMIWTGLACLNQFINSIIWNRNAINWAPVWCDISARFIVGVSIAIPAASLCINRRLYHIACVRVVTSTRADKRRAIMVDLAIGVGLPVLVMGLQYIVQGHRFDIYEDFGCFPVSYYTWPIYPIIMLPPLFIGIVSGVYATLTIIAFCKNRSQFNAMLSSYSKMTSNRFLRLMCLAGVEVMFTVPVCIYAIVLQTQTLPLYPWISWANVHSYFDRADQFPALLWRDPRNRIGEISIESTRWDVVFCAFVFFIFFGFADEARKNYRSAYQSVAKRIGISTGSFGSGLTSFGVFGSNGTNSKGGGASSRVRPILPLFVHREMLQRHDSIDSFTDMSMSIGDVSGALNEKSDPEKADFYSTLSYGALSIADVGNTLGDSKTAVSSPISPASSSSSSSITYPEPVRTRQDSGVSIEISSVRQGSTYIEPNSLTVPTTNSSQSPPQPTGQKNTL
ncbi:STE3-domain-containing protein [Phlegmacium glaucopus]|nr:STE3-domain-containing protein [Phlegmacium glaucopus]